MHEGSRQENIEDQARREVLGVWPQFEQLSAAEIVEANEIREKMGPKMARDVGELLARDSADLPDGFALDMSVVLHQMRLLLKIHRLRCTGLRINLRVWLTCPLFAEISEDPAVTHWIECAIDTALAALEIEDPDTRNRHWKAAARCLLPFLDENTYQD